MPERIDAGTLKRMFLAGAKNLESNKEWINELNVFPVPDGDTGTNMTLTVLSAVRELSTLPDSATVTEVAAKFSMGTLKGARGNSGVIMSQLCRGFSKEVEGVSQIDAKTIAAAFDRAAATAYKAVMKPKEGTILTVARATANKAVELAKEGISLQALLPELIKYSEFVLSKTPDMLPVLKEAGVVDSGGQGLVVFLKGAYDAFLGKDVDISFEGVCAKKAEAPAAGARRIDTSNIETSDIKFGYCTEFIIMLEKEFGDKDETEFKEFLSSLGDSIVCVYMDDIVKVHVHTNHPGQVIEKALTFGSLTSLKIDNMREEHNEKVIKEADRALAEEQAAAKETPADEPKGPRKEVGFVAVCAGDGMAGIFKGMSVDAIIEGGQTMNPSTEDIMAAIDTVNADNVFVLPNNSNIILTATQAQSLEESKNVIVIPTKTVAQGINAVINYVPALSVEENTAHLNDAIGQVKTAEITYAVRDTEIDGKEIHMNDYMGIGEGHMLAVGTDLESVAVETILELADEDSELVTIYYGEGVSEDEAQAIADKAEKTLEDADFEVVYGGQPVYSYIISVE